MPSQPNIIDRVRLLDRRSFTALRRSLRRSINEMAEDLNLAEEAEDLELIDELSSKLRRASRLFEPFNSACIDPWFKLHTRLRHYRRQRETWARLRAQREAALPWLASLDFSDLLAP